MGGCRFKEKNFKNDLNKSKKKFVPFKTKFSEK